MIIAFVAAAMGVATWSIASNSSTASTAQEVMEGHGDGHCTVCGLHNGHYRCAAFCPTYNHPSMCICGHSKSSHSYR